MNFMVRILCLTLVLFSVSLCDTPKNKPFFWKISDENSCVWILGSVHYADETFYPLPSVVDSAFAASDELAVEVDMNDEAVATSAAMRMAMLGMLPQNKLLSQVLPPPMWKTLDSLWSAWGMKFAANITHMRPWFAATVVSTVGMQRMGFDPEYGIDMVLQKRASAAGKKVVSIETVDDQVNALADTSADNATGILYMKSTLSEVSRMDSMVTQMMRAWKTGNDSLMNAVMDEDEKGYSAEELKLNEQLKQKIYINRNIKMADAVAKFLAEDRKVFVTVGAAHLVMFDRNVIQLLRDRGFKVERF